MTEKTDVEVIANNIIGCGIEVHRVLGPGLLESVYRECLLIELAERSLKAQSERRFPVRYKGKTTHSALTVDILVDESVVVELKAVERIHPVHLAQVITYLKLSGYPIGLIMNFNTTSLRAGLRRLDQPDRYRARCP